MLHNTCQASLLSLTNLLDDYTTSSDIPVPARLREKAIAIQEEFQILEEKATERANQIAEILASWAEFHTGLQQFLTWVRSSLSELHSLEEVETFLLEFSALESRFEVGHSTCLSGAPFVQWVLRFENVSLHIHVPVPVYYLVCTCILPCMCTV